MIITACENKYLANDVDCHELDILTDMRQRYLTNGPREWIRWLKPT